MYLVLAHAKIVVVDPEAVHASPKVTRAATASHHVERHRAHHVLQFVDRTVKQAKR